MKRTSAFLALCFITLSLFLLPVAASSASVLGGGEAGSYYLLDNAQVEVRASSELEDQYGAYPASNANDSNSKTAWVEGASDNGSGEWLEFTFPKQEILGFTIRTGYQKSSDTYGKNARPRGILVHAQGAPNERITLEDTEGEQAVLFDQALTTDYLTIELSSFYEGSKYQDTCITDVGIILGKRDTHLDAWRMSFHGFITDHFDTFYEWNWMKLIDFDFDGIPELVVCTEYGHGSPYIIVSSQDTSTWSEFSYGGDDEEIFKLYKNQDTGELIWLVKDIYAAQGSETNTLSRLEITQSGVVLHPLFFTAEVWDDELDNYGEKLFRYKENEVTEDEYKRQHEKFFTENTPVEFKVAQSDASSTSVDDALFHFDEMCSALGL